jgi:hypothetical protein
MEKVRAMLHASGLPKSLWGVAVMHATWLKNRSSTRALPKGKTPYELLYGKKPDLGGLCEFGAKVWVHDEGNNKLGARVGIGRWIGFEDYSSGSYIYWSDTGKITIEQNVRYDDEASVHLPSGVQNEGKVGENVQSLTQQHINPDPTSLN